MSHIVFYDLALKVTLHHFPDILLFTKVSPNQCRGEGPHQSKNTVRQGSLGTILQTGYHSGKIENLFYIVYTVPKAEYPSAENTERKSESYCVR